jgi:hypothetical protein
MAKKCYPVWAFPCIWKPLLRTLRIICITLLLASILAVPVSAQPSIVLDGKPMKFEVPPVVENGRTLVPLRAIFEALGATVKWDESTQTITAVKGNTVIKMTIGNTTAYTGNRPVILDVPGKLVDGRTLVPLRFVGESLGAQVQYDSDTETINLTSSMDQLTPKSPVSKQSTSIKPASMPRGQSDPDFIADVYVSDLAYPGTTLLIDNHNLERPRIIEVNMLGEIVWKYELPESLREYTNPGFDVELLPNNNILMELPRKGVYEINRKGDIVWSYLDEKVSHDADLLPNGNILVAFGADDGVNDAQVKEINRKGETVWSWKAGKYFNKRPYNEIYRQGWTHTNAVTRLSNGNTLISLRNFNFIVEVDPQGTMVSKIGEGVLRYQHDPEVLPNGDLLVASHDFPNRAVQIHPQTGKIVWQYLMPPEAHPVRDANRLPNGNTLITGSNKIVEVTPGGEIVWQFVIKGVPFNPKEASALGFYKAERIDIQNSKAK